MSEVSNEERAVAAREASKAIEALKAYSAYLNSPGALPRDKPARNALIESNGKLIASLQDELNRNAGQIFK